MIPTQHPAHTGITVLIALAVSATVCSAARAQSTLDIRSDNALRRTETDSSSQARKAAKDEEKKKQEKRAPGPNIKQQLKTKPNE